MANFDIQNYMITFLLVVGVMVTFGTVAYNLGQDYDSMGGATVDGDFKETYNKLDMLEDRTDEMREKIEEVETEEADSRHLSKGRI